MKSSWDLCFYNIRNKKLLRECPATLRTGIIRHYNCPLSTPQAVATGATNVEAFLAAIKSFAGQIKKLADYGLPTIDSACLRSAQDYLATNQVSSSPLMSAMEAFVQKAVEIDVGYDPVCYAAADKFIESSISGRRDDVSLQMAAKEFLSLYFANPIVANRSRVVHLDVEDCSEELLR